MGVYLKDYNYDDKWNALKFVSKPRKKNNLPMVIQNLVNSDEYCVKHIGLVIEEDLATYCDVKTVYGSFI